MQRWNILSGMATEHERGNAEASKTPFDWEEDILYLNAGFPINSWELVSAFGTKQDRAVVKKIALNFHKEWAHESRARHHCNWYSLSRRLREEFSEMENFVFVLEDAHRFLIEIDEGTKKIDICRDSTAEGLSGRQYQCSS
jgi:hypothetical protein